MRDALTARGIAAYQVYATADLGSIAYESPAREGLIVDEGVLVEIVRPGTGDPVAPGEVGEVVVTHARQPRLPADPLRHRRSVRGASGCHRRAAAPTLRIKGWMGRADQTTKVKGMFVHPSQVAEIVRRHPDDRPRAARRRQSRRQRPHDAACRSAPAPPPDVDAIVATIRDVTKLRGEVAVPRAGALANDGKIIDDVRKH